MSGIVPYKPAEHAAEQLPFYEERHVIIAPIPLLDLSQPADGDRSWRSAATKGHPSECPKLESLSATPSDPPIEGFERAQLLSVLCGKRLDISDPDGPYFYPVCAQRAEAEGYNTYTPKSVLVSPDTLPRIRCPISSLQAEATDATGNIVPIMLFAKNPHAE